MMATGDRIFAVLLAISAATAIWFGWQLSDWLMFWVGILFAVFAYLAWQSANQLNGWLYTEIRKKRSELIEKEFHKMFKQKRK